MSQEPSRREFLHRTAASGIAVASAITPAPENSAATQPSPQSTRATSVPLSLVINDKKYELELEPRVSLLDTLRSTPLTGTKKGCDHGQCGACTVLVNGRRIYPALLWPSCMSGPRLPPSKGLPRGRHCIRCRLPLSGATLSSAVIAPPAGSSAVGLLNEGHARSDADIRELMSGNICRCGAYSNILAAIKDAQRPNERQP